MIPPLPPTTGIFTAANVLSFLGILAVYGGILYAAIKNSLSKRWNDDIDKKIAVLKTDIKEDIDSQKSLMNSQIKTIREGLNESKSAVLRYHESSLAAQMSISQIQGKLMVIENRGNNKDE